MCLDQRETFALQCVMGLDASLVQSSLALL